MILIILLKLLTNINISGDSGIIGIIQTGTKNNLSEISISSG
jgi:hypothetical protein